tara:strand:- start:85624 stop:86415 length:792 start_codon:yes stop_codon:yes gene_type:complete
MFQIKKDRMNIDKDPRYTTIGFDLNSDNPPLSKLFYDTLDESEAIKGILKPSQRQTGEDANGDYIFSKDIDIENEDKTLLIKLAESNPDLKRLSEEIGWGKISTYLRGWEWTFYARSASLNHVVLRSVQFNSHDISHATAIIVLHDGQYQGHLIYYEFDLPGMEKICVVNAFTVSTVNILSRGQVPYRKGIMKQAIKAAVRYAIRRGKTSMVSPSGPSYMRATLSMFQLGGLSEMETISLKRLRPKEPIGNSQDYRMDLPGNF